jgi:hypothetical protein
MEAAQTKFLRHLLGIARLDRERNQSIREKLGGWNSVGNKTLPTRVATACREDKYRQDMQTGTEMYAKGEEKHRMTEEKMEGPASP